MKKHEAVEGERELKGEGGSWASSHSASGLSPAEGTVLPVSFLDGKRMCGAACGCTNGHLPFVEGSEWGQWNRGWRRNKETKQDFWRESVPWASVHLSLYVLLQLFNDFPAHPVSDLCHVFYFLGDSTLKMVGITTVPPSPLDVTIFLWPCLLLICLLRFSPPGSIKGPDSKFFSVQSQLIMHLYYILIGYKFA